MNINLQAHLLVFVATFLIALSFIVSGKLSGVIDPISLTLCRFVIAVIVLAPFILLKTKFRINVKKSFSKGLKISLFYSLYFILLFKALEDTTALNTATLFTLVPLLTAIISIFAFKQKLSIKKIFVYIIGIFGTSIVIFNGDLQLFIEFSLNKGDTLFFIAIISMALYSISVKYFSTNDDIPLVLTFTTLLGGIFWMTLTLLFLDIPLEWDKLKGEYFYYILYLSIAATLFTVFLYQKATIIIGPNKVMAYVYINPVIVLIMNLFYDKEISNIYVVLGCLISSTATYFLLRK
ncbi:DMT family transporter [Halarcobacter sp.]|uniref:DMT family transporter n=1 Tax=Halarcobacter sp. TaxID=2321133 RepID=UPI002AA89E4F|nr:DMT family transporter [Halarcobacter sp.]